MTKFKIEKDWVTESGLRAVVIFGINTKTRCGYIAVPKTHVTYGKTYREQLNSITQSQADTTSLGNKSPMLLLTAVCGSDDEFNSVRRSLDIIIEVHGGITYNSNSVDSNYPVEADGLWWFGYDCNHFGDNLIIGGRSLKYCIHECESMAEQLQALDARSQITQQAKNTAP